MRLNRPLSLVIIAYVVILVAVLIFPRYRADKLSSPLPSGDVSYAAPPAYSFSPYIPHRDFFKGLVAGKLMTKDLSEEDKQWVQKIVTHFDFSSSELLHSQETCA
ncbi:hypothetical protein FJY93_03320 [Candidatus Kaiserbacteria bacterium]|nr:hypothetical protein [Candidatus Kaiserbacteria bacterium]